MLRCVIIDDDSDWLDLARRCIAQSRLDLKVSLFLSAADAVEFIRRNEVAVVVADYRMPGLSGLDVAAMLRMEGIQVPVVMISSDDSVEAEAMRAGIDAFVMKGHLASRLAPAVERFVNPRAVAPQQTRSLR